MRTGRSPAFSALIVVAFFGIVEAALWIAGVPTLLSERDPFLGFSRSTRVFQEVPGRDLLRTDPRAVVHSFNDQEFLRTKPPNGFRLFTLGGSSAYGFPRGADVAFTRILGDALQAARPGRLVEPINAAAMSYASHRMRILVHEVLGYRPDLLVLFEGHNEFIETRFYRDLIGRTEALDPLRTVLYRWRLYSAMVRLLRPHAAPADGGAAGGTVGEQLGLDVVREERSWIADAEKEEVRARFEENLRAMLDAAGAQRVPVVLCTVPSNLRDWAPVYSAFAPEVSPEAQKRTLDLLARAAREGGRPSAAARLLEEARALAPGYAATHFTLGRAYEALGRWDDAREAYRAARDADAQPARAPTAFNDTIRRLAAGGGALLVDIERIFEADSPHGLVGFNLIEDYVHPNPEGHRVIALEIYRAVVEGGLLGEPRTAETAPFERAVAARDGRLGAGSQGSEGETRQASMLFNLAIVLENKGLAEEAMGKYRECLAVRPDHYAARCNLCRLLNLAGRPGEAAEECGKGLEVAPSNLNCLLELGTALTESGRSAEAEATFASAVEADPRSSLAWNGWGLALAQQDRIAEAAQKFRRALDLDPRSADALANLGQTVLILGRVDEAIAHFRGSLALRRDQRRARVGLAAALIRKGEYAEAGGIYREILAEEPEDPWALRGLAEIEALSSRPPRRLR